MTAFITHCCKSVRLDVVGLLACAWLLLIWPVAVQAQARLAEVGPLRIERVDDAVFLSTQVDFVLSSAVEEALLKGAAIFFVAEVEVLRERWYWTDKRITHSERHMRLTYQPLTRRWRLNVASGKITSTGIGMALSQNFDSLSDALAVLKRLSRWKIADMADLNPADNHTLEFRFQLDASQLPRPLQIGTLGQSDWIISAATSQALVFEGVP
jgi:hypothetical protein